MATVAVNEFVFKQPVRLGDILSFYANVTRIGRTSITVQVEVFAERFGAQGAVRQGDRGHRSPTWRSTTTAGRGPSPSRHERGRADGQPTDTTASHRVLTSAA